ncbi:hypothetical protein IEQ34_010811 [Dendrobium chrysotoxum]|uniref:Uncharacterized protein n=1 Tax=Dendrobium chrysotoxum TaxID=161865 RepID=A0AAV7GWP7_DENCH|nr:hypothetical protein IEQ34_010811 [Dendrobium chrysotoxum]
MGDQISTKNPSAKDNHFVAQSEGLKMTYKAIKTDYVTSTVTSDSLITFRKKFYFPNDMVMKVPTRSDCARFPPPGFVTVYEFSLRAGLRFSPSPKLIDILTICGVSLSQLSYKIMSIIMGLIGRISFRSNWLNIRTLDPSKSWISDFFFVQNDWNLLKKWGKLKKLPIPLYIRAEDLLKILKLSDINALYYEVRYLSRYIDEEHLFKMGLSTQAGRSHAQMLKKLVKVPKAVTQPSKAPSKRPGSEEDLQASKKKKVEEILLIQYADFKLEMIKTLNDWNNKFVKIKYLQGEYKKKSDGKIKEMKTVEDKLAECRAELTNIMTSASLQNQQMDRLHIKLEARNHIYDVEVKDLEAYCIEEGFIRGFMKGVCTLQRKIGAEIEGLTPNQASIDHSSDSGGEEIESELQKALSLSRRRMILRSCRIVLMLVVPLCFLSSDEYMRLVLMLLYDVRDI